MNTEIAGPTPSLPALKITPAMVKRMAKKLNITVTTEDAVRWLLRHKPRIENNLYCATIQQVQDVLFETTIVDWPDPAFNRMYRRIEKAVYDAIFLLERTESLQHVYADWPVDELIAITHAYLRYRGRNSLTRPLLMSVRFIQIGADLNSPAEEIPCVFAVAYRDKSVTATLAKKTILSSVSEGERKAS